MIARAEGVLREDTEHAALAGREQNGSETGSVRLMTMHRAKGLEFPHVFLPAWEDGVFPSVRAVDEGSGDEERRLAYVAITRAMRRLTISYEIGRAHV